MLGGTDVLLVVCERQKDARADSEARIKMAINTLPIEEHLTAFDLLAVAKPPDN